jgi:hypothetical protein
VLVAVADLQAMRCNEGESTPAGGCAPRLGREQLERQAPLFARDPALFGYLRAAEAYYVRHQPREVLAQIPDAARQKRFTYLEFSRQALRGLALDAVGDRNARGFWLSLFDGAVQPYQREALELALALHDERSGGLARIFAPDSKVRHPVIRQLLLERVAGPELLRQQARDPRAPKQERDVARSSCSRKSCAAASTRISWTICRSCRRERAATAITAARSSMTPASAPSSSLPPSADSVREGGSVMPAAPPLRRRCANSPRRPKRFALASASPNSSG